MGDLEIENCPDMNKIRSAFIVQISPDGTLLSAEAFRSEAVQEIPEWIKNCKFFEKGQPRDNKRSSFFAVYTPQ